MRIADRVQASTLLVVLLLTAQIVLTVVHADEAPFGDEIYWVGKARYLMRHGALPRVEPAALEVDRELRHGNSDWRPQAYTFFVAACSLGDFGTPGLRRRVVAVQATLLALVLVLLYLIALQSGLSQRARWIAAFVFGGTPWAFEYAELIGDGPLSAVVVTVGMLILWRWITRPASGTKTLFAGALVTCSTLLIRAEMIVVAPLATATALLLGRRTLRHVAVAAFGLLLPLVLQVGYRTWATGSLGVFGGLHVENHGAFRWANTWLGTEKEGYDFVIALTNGAGRPLPDRAFANAIEERTVEAIVSRVESSGRYTAEDDATFDRLAAERRQRQPIFTVALRVWHAVHLWVNVDTPNYVLESLSVVPRGVRRPVYGLLFALKLILLAAGIAAACRSALALLRGQADPFDRLTLLLAAFVLARTLLIGVVLNWKIHRYVLAAWPSLIWCAGALLRRRTELAGEPSRG